MKNINELRISYKNNYIFLELNSNRIMLEFINDYEKPDPFVIKRIDWLVNNPEFLDFLINNYKHNEEILDFDKLILKHSEQKSYQILLYKIKMTINYILNMRETLIKLKYNPHIKIKLQDDMKSLTIENIVKLQNDERIKNFFDYNYLQLKYPEYFL